VSQSSTLSRMPKVSVILASYNGARYLPETLKSLQRQTLGDFEIVIVDDGSSQPTLDVLARFAESDPRIRVHHAAHAGLVQTVNTAISLARGVYVARIDHDDVCRPERLERQAAYLDAHPDCVAVGCDIDFMDGNGRIYKVGKSHARHDPHAPLAFPPHPNFLPGPTLMARASALKTVGGYRAACFAAEDRDICWRLGALGPTYRLRERLVLWRNHGAGTTANTYLTQMASHAIGDLSAVALALGLDDSAIIADVVVGGDYLPIIARYKALLGARYPVDTYWYFFLMRYRVWQLSGERTEDALLKKVRAHCNENPADWRRWKLRRRALMFERRDRTVPAVPDANSN
jgi:glycosyltransferase involved in cell wall biosynthesis